MLMYMVSSIGLHRVEQALLDKEAQVLETPILLATMELSLCHILPHMAIRYIQSVLPVIQLLVIGTSTHLPRRALSLFHSHVNLANAK